MIKSIMSFILMLASTAYSSESTWTGSVKRMQRVIEAMPSNERDQNAPFIFIPANRADAAEGTVATLPTIIRVSKGMAPELTIYKPLGQVHVDLSTISTECRTSKNAKGGNESENLAPSFLSTYFYRAPDWVNSPERKKTWNDVVNYCKNVYPTHQAFQTKTSPTSNKGTDGI